MILGILLVSVIIEFLAVVVWCSRRASCFSQSWPCCFRPPPTMESPWSRNWTNNKQSTEQFFLLLRSASTWNGVMKTETVFYMASFYDEPSIFQWRKIRHLHIFQWRPPLPNCSNHFATGTLFFVLCFQCLLPFIDSFFVCFVFKFVFVFILEINWLPSKELLICSLIHSEHGMIFQFFMCVCVCVCVPPRARMCVCVCVRVRERERERAKSSKYND